MSRTYQLSIGKSTDIVTWEKATVLSTIDESIKVLQRLIDHNESIWMICKQHPSPTAELAAQLNLKQFTTYFGTRWTSRSDYAGHIHSENPFKPGHPGNQYRPQTPNTWDIASAANAGYRKMISDMEHVKKKVEAGKKMAKTDAFFIFKPYIYTGDPMYSHYYNNIVWEYKNATVPNTVICVHCKARINAAHITAHQDTARCKNERIKKSLTERKFRTIPHRSKLYNLATVGNLPDAELIPIQYEVWVPEWVWQANEMYEKNSGTNGKYANLSIGEFINKMRPAQESDGIDETTTAV